MKNFNIKFHIVLLSIILASGASLKGQENQTSLEMDLSSDYIWRDLVYGFPVIQPTFTRQFDSSGFSLSVWTSIGAKFQTNDIELSSTLSYDFSLFQKFSISTGLVHYVAPVNTELEGKDSRNTNSIEAFVLLSKESLLLSPSFQAYYDLSGGPTYMALDITQSISQSKKHPLELNLMLGYSATNEDKSTDGFRHFTATVSLPFTLKRQLDFTLFSNYIYLFQEAKQHRARIGITLYFK